jgi:hypothetical protein
VKVRDVIKLIGDDGWVQVAARASHRQFKHPIKSGAIRFHLDGLQEDGIQAPEPQAVLTYVEA